MALLPIYEDLRSLWRGWEEVTIATTDGPKETSITIALETTALVIVDMQNFFLDSKCLDHPHGLNAVGPTIKVIEKCREEGIQVYPLLLGLESH